MSFQETSKFFSKVYFLLLYNWRSHFDKKMRFLFVNINVFVKPCSFSEKISFYICRWINFQDIPPKTGNSVAISEDASL